MDPETGFVVKLAMTAQTLQWPLSNTPLKGWVSRLLLASPGGRGRSKARQVDHHDLALLKDDGILRIA